MTVKAQIVDGPHEGKTYALTYPPHKMYLPIWPEPDLDGPPYSYAMYEMMSGDTMVRYKYIGTQAP